MTVPELANRDAASFKTTAIQAPFSQQAESNLFDAAVDYALLLNWRVFPLNGDKTPMTKWTNFRSVVPTMVDFKAWFRGRPDIQGIGVIVGDPSGGLVCRDFDKVEAYHTWASKHSDLAAMLPTVQTARGYHVYCHADHRRIVKYDDGELRGDGYMVLPPSRHPAGTFYKWLIAPASENLLWIDDLDKAGLVGIVQAESNSRRSRDMKAIKEPGTADGVLDATASLETRIELAIERTLPEGPGERNYLLFEFARYLKAIDRVNSLSDADIEDAVTRWHHRAEPVIHTKAVSVSIKDFWHAWDSMQFAEGEGSPELALSRARDSKPPEAANYRVAQLKLLVSICCDLQRDSGDDPFYLSAPKAAQLLDVDDRTAGRYLWVLVKDGLLTLVEKGGIIQGVKRANRYRYCCINIEKDSTGCGQNSLKQPAVAGESDPADDDPLMALLSPGYRTDINRSSD